MKEESVNKYTIPMLEKVMELLEILSKNRNGLTLQEIHNKLEYSKTTIFRILTTLLEMGYVGKDADNNRFYISKKMFELGLAALGEENLVERAIEPMTRLRDEVKESVMLGALVDDKVVLLEHLLGSHNFTFTIKSGTKICIHASAPGKVLFADQTPERQAELLQSIEFIKFNENTIVAEADFLKEIEKTKEKGYGVDIEEEIYGVYCIGAPIYNRYGDAIACVWISAPKGRLPLGDFDRVGDLIKKCVATISGKLGYKISH